MIFRNKRPRALALNEPLRHPDHKRPISRRDFLAQGFMTGAASVMVPSMLGAMLNPRMAKAALSGDINPSNFCNIQNGAGKVPFICFDLAGGANIAGSNVLVGQAGGQLDFLSTAGYSKLGLPGNMTPANSTTNFINTELGLAFHSDSAFLRGIQSMTTTTTRALVNGAVIPAMSQNDTANNMHNPMYGIAKFGSRGQLLTLIGSQSSDSGGNSMAYMPGGMLDPTVRPTKVNQPSDATGLVDTGQLGTLLGSPTDTVKVMESIDRISRDKVAVVNPKLADSTQQAALKTQIECTYVKSADMTDQFGSPSVLDAKLDPNITAIFAGVNGIASDSEFSKTAAVMKLVVDGMAGAGTIEMGGFDYHTGDRSTGEARDFRAGQCMGACLEYAARTGKPLMLYVFSDGSLNSNGMVDSSTGGRGKGVWTGDNQSTASAFFLVLGPQGRPQLYTGDSAPAARHQQIGYFQASGDVNTTSSPAANAVNLLAETVILNYMALHGAQGTFKTVLPSGGLSTSLIDSLIAFNPIA
jgi:hypothetical protein